MSSEPLAESGCGPILLCAGTDCAVAARLAEAAACLLKDRPVVVLSIWDPPPLMGSYDAVMDALYDTHAELRHAARHAAADAAGAACEVLDTRGFDVTRRVIADERGPWQTILEVGNEIDAAVIVSGVSEGATASPGALGRQARALAHRTDRPLLLLTVDGVPAHASAPAIFAYDGSAPAGDAIQAAARLLRPRPAIVASAWQTASQAVGVARIAIPDDVARKGIAALDAASRRDAETHADAGAAMLTAAGWTCAPAAFETPRNAATAIIAAADEHDAAIIVTATRGRSRIAAALLGSTAETILRHAGRPVLLIASTAREHERPAGAGR